MKLTSTVLSGSLPVFFAMASNTAAAEEKSPAAADSGAAEAKVTTG